MRDLAENLAVLDTLPALERAAAVYDGGVIDLADYGYPRKILVLVTVGGITGAGTLGVDLESGDTAATCEANTDAGLAVIDATGNLFYEYKPTRRYINIEAEVLVAAVDFAVVLIMEHCRFGGRGMDD